MATEPLSAEEKTFLDTPPDAIPLDEVTVTDDGKIEDAPKPDAVKSDTEKGKKAKPKEGDAKVEGEDDDGTKPPSGFVPHGAMQRERSEKQRLAKELADERRASTERDARIQERLAIINEALKPPAAAPPNPDEDIFAYAQNLEARLNASERRDQEREQYQRQLTEQQTQLQGLTAAYAADAARFRRETPDFNAAYQFLLQSRYDELSAIGYDDTAINNAIRQDELNIAHFQLARGGSPAETIYNLASRRGYKPPEPDNGKANGADNGAGKPSAADQIARLKDAQDASASLSQGGGSPDGGTRITLESLDRMSRDEFKAFVGKINKNDPNAYDRLMEKLQVGRA